MDLLKNLKILVFDFDGTIHDIKSDWAQSRRILGIESSSESMGDAINRLKRNGNNKPIAELDAAEAKTLKNEKIDPVVKLIIQNLSKKYKLTVFSRNSSKVIADFLNRNGVEIDLVVGREDVEKIKPHPEGLKLILEKMGCQPSEAIMIGDTDHDVLVAQAAGVPSIIVGEKYHSSSDIRPDYWLDSFIQLKELLS